MRAEKLIYFANGEEGIKDIKSWRTRVHLESALGGTLVRRYIKGFRALLSAGNGRINPETYNLYENAALEFLEREIHEYIDEGKIDLFSSKKRIGGVVNPLVVLDKYAESEFLAMARTS